MGVNFRWNLFTNL